MLDGTTREILPPNGGDKQFQRVILPLRAENYPAHAADDALMLWQIHSGTLHSA
jgi:hypothetical protein